MKKSVVCFIILIFIILFGILFFKIYLSNPKYSSEELYALVQKGIENMHDMQNVCIERKNEVAVVKHYYKGNKMKMVVLKNTNDSLSYSIVDLDEEKQYLVSDKNKYISIQKATSMDKGLQYMVFNSINPKGDNLRRELSYIKDENIEGKDCIFVKEITYSKIDDGTFQSDSKSNEDICAYWIEKSTGFVLALALIKPAQTDATPKVWIEDITFNEVLDTDFALPTNYKIYNTTK